MFCYLGFVIGKDRFGRTNLPKLDQSCFLPETKPRHHREHFGQKWWKFTFYTPNSSKSSKATGISKGVMSKAGHELVDANWILQIKITF